MQLHSLFGPDGAFQFLLLALALTLVGAVVYLLVYTNANVPF